ncbi:MAG: hypothetical protein ACAI18_09865 [Gemmatimonadales bacterium]
MHGSRSRGLRTTALLVVTVLAGCGGTVSSGPPATPLSSTPAGASAGAGPTPGPASSPGSSHGAGLPEPTLTDPTAIGAALWDPAQVETGVVSLIEQLGIDIYTADGKLLRDAAAAGPPRMCLFESEVRGLIEMGETDATSIAGHAVPYTLVDLYKGLHDVYPELSQDQLLQAYIEAYRAAPGDLVRESFAGHAFVPEAGFTRVHLWLFVLDGVLGRPQPPTSMVRTVAFTGPITAAAPVAQVQLPQPSQALAQLMAVELTSLPIVIAHMATLAFTLPVDATTSSSTAHEGHGGAAGQPVTFAVKSRFVPTPLVSPILQLLLLAPYRTSLEGLPVNFRSPQMSVLDAHGTLSPTPLLPVFTDVLGEARMLYTPRAEPADGQGDLKTDVAIVNVEVELREILLYMYPAGGAANLGVGTRQIPLPLVIEWHEDTATPNPGVPGTYNATLIGAAPGAGSWSGEGTIICSRSTVNGHQVWSVSSGPLSGGLSGILMIDNADGKSIYVTPQGLGIEAQWGMSGPASNVSVIDVTGQFGNPSVVAGTVEYTYGVNPPIPYSLSVTVTCSDTYDG